MCIKIYFAKQNNKILKEAENAFNTLVNIRSTLKHALTPRHSCVCFWLLVFQLNTAAKPKEISGIFCVCVCVRECQIKWSRKRVTDKEVPQSWSSFVFFFCLFFYIYYGWVEGARGCIFYSICIYYFKKLSVVCFAFLMLEDKDSVNN